MCTDSFLNILGNRGNQILFGVFSTLATATLTVVILRSCPRQLPACAAKLTHTAKNLSFNVTLILKLLGFFMQCDYLYKKQMSFFIYYLYLFNKTKILIIKFF